MPAAIRPRFSNESSLRPNPPDLRKAAAITALAVGMIAAAFLVYALRDVLIVFFLGIVVACALQPWHATLCRLGIPKAVAVILIYLAFVLAVGLIGLFVVPVVLDKITAFADAVPEKYQSFLASVRGSHAAWVRIAGARLPSFAALTRSLSGLWGTFFVGALGLTMGTATVLAYFVSVLAIAFYWTLEVPRFERYVVSLVPVARRAQTLNSWHEIEYKLGAFIRGQGIAMITIGAASAVGYSLIGLPNVLVLSIFAGLLEAVPVLGPILTSMLAIVIALPMGVPTVAAVVAFGLTLQFLESNWLIPRIMSRSVGVSPLIGLLSILALGSLCGVVGVFIAIPVAAVAQVLLDPLLADAEPVPQGFAPSMDRLAEVRARVHALKRQMRSRLRERDTRMGIDPRTLDHVMDSVDQEIEQALERIEAVMADLGQPSEAVVTDLNEAAEHVEEVVDQVLAAGQERPTAAEGSSELPVEELSRATQRAAEAVERIESRIVVPGDPPGPTDRGARS